ncbi:MAG: UvrD-helicase domain-containing protein [Deltaproteobacteria bacterium]|nr:UvrD-helicase domain-containing protein [Deltaproteobacteria bacterium]
MSASPRIWDELAELRDEATWLIEASAGTGKTYQIANLVLRLVVEEGLPIERILAITFTRAATAELRERVRKRLRQAHAALGAMSPATLDLTDRVLASFLEQPADVRVRARATLEVALRAFDAAPIATIHGFTQRVLEELSFESSEEAGLALTGDASAILGRLVDDTLVRLATELDADGLERARSAGVERDTLLSLATEMTAAVAPLVEGAPPQLPTATDLGALARGMAADLSAAPALFAATLRSRFEAELRRRRALTFDAMLARLAERMRASGGPASPLARALRERYHAVLVDEFQDTDAAQWSALRDAFHGYRRLFLIGDPKQAIYGFRGADVHVYLEAKRAVAVERQATMTTNWRSDPQVIHAMNTFYRAGSEAFDVPGIDYVEARAAAAASRVEPAGPGLVVRPFGDASGGPLGNKTKAMRKASREAARAIRALLDGETRVLEATGPRRVAPSDVGVLVSSHRQADQVRRDLREQRIPAVAASRESVFDTPASRWLAAWLDAVAGAGRDRAARRAVVSPLFGWTAEELAWGLAVAEDARLAASRPPELVARDWDAWSERLRRASERWPYDGFARVFDRELDAHGSVVRLLAGPFGERDATDLRHLFELAHLEERARRLGPAALSRWLRASASEEGEAEERRQRLESDALAVRIETVHVSKGLEYPFVFLPFAWTPTKTVSPGGSSGPPYLKVRDEDGAHLHFAPSSPAACSAWNVEQQREELRRLYVALTRAEHRTVVWFGVHGRGATSESSGLGRLLLRDDEPGPLACATYPVAPSAELDARLDALASRSGGAIVCERLPPAATSKTWQPEAPSARPLVAQGWPAERARLEGPFVVTSFSAMHDAAAVPDDDEPLRLDRRELDPRATAPERDAPTGLVPPALDATLVDGPRGLEASGGAAYGTWVHAVLEGLDFASGAPLSGVSLAEHLAATGSSLGVPDAHEAALELAQQLPAILDTPLDCDGSRDRRDSMRHLPPGFRLRELDRRARRDELSFDLRLGAGTRYRSAPVASPRGVDSGGRGLIDPVAFARAVVSRRGAGAPLVGEGAPWLDAQARRIERGGAFLGRQTGILTGSIDLVFRVRRADGEGHTYFLADYKTNRIVDSSPAHYTGAWLDWEMARKGYPLQALLYTVALHRHLRARLGERYDYDEHVGGYLYLFLRGMTEVKSRDPATGRCLGVLGDRWPRDVVLAVDRALESACSSEADA